MGADIVRIFRSSLNEGHLPSQWRLAKIVLWRKPGKPDYAVARAWPPIFLLPTLSKALEALLMDRISFMAEECGLLPQNRFRAGKGRSAKDALLVLEKKIYDTGSQRLVVSRLSFDVKGAYNGVFKDRLTQRPRARRIPKRLIQWIDSFCNSRSASIVVNGESQSREL